jgi:molecular chaperone Hsp33
VRADPATNPIMVRHRGADDLVLPFHLPDSGVRGRLVRLGHAAQEILSRHDYPPPVAHLLAELLVLAGGLGSLMKFDGVFSLQTKGDGPVKLMVADVTSTGALRAYAEVDGRRLQALGGEGRAPSFRSLLGQGYLALTVDPQGQQRYQGIVALEGERLADSLLHYFRQSEQLDTAIHLAAEPLAGSWRAAALILQRLPEIEHGVDEAEREQRQEAWRRARILLGTLSDRELLDASVMPERLLWRLFHEEGVAAETSRPLAAACRCSRRRIEGVLASLSDAELAEMTVDGLIRVTCQFCNQRHDFDRAQVNELLTRLRGGR